MEIRKVPERGTLTEACEVCAFRDETEEPRMSEAAAAPEVPHARPGAIEAVRMIMGHGELTVLPDDSQFGDNDFCYVDA